MGELLPALWLPSPMDSVRNMVTSLTSRFGSRGCIFTFHRVAPSAVWKTLPNRNFYIDLDFFDEFLTHLGRSGWEIVTVEQALQRASRNNTKDRYVNFSVDDCYRDTFDQAVPLFRRHGAPITLYVTTGIPDGTVPMWWTGLEEALLLRRQVIVGNEVLTVETATAKREAFARIEGEWNRKGPEPEYAAFCEANGIDAAAVHWRHAISWEMLEELRADPLVEIGVHGATHRRISELEPDAALAELNAGRERMMKRIGVTARHFAFPYGRAGDCGPRDFELVRQAGFFSAATTRKGVIRPGQDAFQLPRNTLNGAHQNLPIVNLHLKGLTGFAARVLGRV